MVEIVAEAGYEAVTVRKLARLAGVSTGTFYEQFGGKEECLISTYSELMNRVRAQVASTRDGASERRPQVVRSVYALLMTFADDPRASRLELIEIFSGGPAAIGLVKAANTQLEAVVRECLDRRGRRVSPQVVGWITSSVLYWARARLAEDRAVGTEADAEIVRWAEELLFANEIDLSRCRSSSEPRAEAAGPEGPRRSTSEADLILMATLRLAAGRGYWGLSVREVSRAAGVPATRFTRNFVNVEDAYLKAIDHAARQFFAPAVAGGNAAVDWTQVVVCNVSGLLRTVMDRPKEAVLIFSGILEPGLRGLTLREDLVRTMTDDWGVPAHFASTIRQQAAAASLWDVIAQAADADQLDHLPRTSPTFAYFFLSGLVGTTEAAKAVEDRANRRSEAMDGS